MDVSAVSSASVMPPVAMAPALQALEASAAVQAEMVEKLLAVNITNQVSAQKMEIAGQIIDAYA